MLHPTIALLGTRFPWAKNPGTMFLDSPIKSVQSGTIALTGAATNTATITSVVPGNCVIKFRGLSASGSDTNQIVCARVELTNATTVTALRYSAAADQVDVSYEVIEYWPGVIRSVQRGTATQSAGTVNTTITAVNTLKATVDLLGFRINDASATTMQNCMRLALSTATNLQSISSLANSQELGYQVVEWW